MGVIRVLSDQIANKIAAGEVVERPASVVKELVENALDAGARRLHLEVEAGGRTRIRLTDDGCGMVRDDALLALERHATSKLTDVASLSAISTLGFRGEALPAIAAVSHLTLETAPQAGGAGVRVVVHGGKLKAVDDAGLPAGTSITVAQLFANIPARKKFLKSETTELGHITTLFTHYALAYPEVYFRLDTAHRTLLSLEPVAGHGERLEQVFGSELMQQCVEFREVAAWPPPAPGELEGSDDGTASEVTGLGMFGFASRPELQKLNRNSMFVFVNRRLVRDRLVQHAISSAYHNLLPSNAFPALLLFLDLPYAEVDVNVHPSKTEVRFRRQNFIHDAVRDAIRNAISASRPVPSFLREREARATAGPVWMPPAPPARPIPMSPGADAALGISTDDLPSGFQLRAAALPPQPQRLPLGPMATGSAGARPAQDGGWVPETGAGCGLREQAGFEPAGSDDLGVLAPLGQIRDSFIVAAAPSGLWLVDQHAAHERILFEQLLAQRAAAAPETQRLLLPQVIELDPGRWLAFGEMAPELAAAGFEAEPFGRASVAVKAVPAGIAPEQAERLLQELLQVAALEDRGLSLQTIRTRILATIACHAAIKINMRLEREKMIWLVSELARCEFPIACPHGRPVLLRYGMDEIQRAFKRIR